MRYDDGFWNEWYLWFEDGSDGWLSDASGQYAVTRRRRAKTAREMPAFDQIKPGFFFKLDGQNYVASDIRTCAAGGTQGELPFVADGGWQAKVADFRSLDAFLTLDYSDGPDPELYIGRAFALSDMQAASLRNADQVRETAGRFRGQIKALDCPNCGGSISFVAAMATQVVCPSCGSTVDCAGEKAEVIEKARKLKSIKTTLALGETASIDGADYSLIGLMKCADPDPEEPSQWIEYLMFNPAQGFLWLVETDEGLGARQGLRYLAQPGQCVHRALAVAPVPQAVRLHVASGSGAGRVQLARQGRRQHPDHRLPDRQFQAHARAGRGRTGLVRVLAGVGGAIGRMVQAAGAGGAEVVGRRGKSGAYAGWAWIATIVLAFLNFDNILEGRLLPSLIGLAFLWLPAKLADKLSGRGE